MRIRPLAAALLCAAPLLHAEETTEPVIVTASRMAETTDATLAPVTVITREEIARSQAPTLLELLRLQPGVDVARTGGPGKETSVFLRGTNSNHVLVLIDGMRVSSATNGGFAWQSLDPAQIERIEIVRGPRSTLYGSDAIGGVIQIFTRKPEGATLRAAAASHETHSWQAGFGGGEETRYHLLVSGADSRGIDATTPDAATAWFVPDGDRDGYRQNNVSASVASRSGSSEAALSFWRSDSRSDYDSGVPGPAAQKALNQAVEARYTSEVTAGWVQSLRLGTAVDDLETVASSRFVTHRHSADWQHTFAVTDEQSLVAGVDWTEDRGKDLSLTGLGTVYERHVTDRGAYFNYTVPVGALDLQGGLRRDQSDIFGYQTTGQAAIGYAATDKLRLLASYGTAYKAPSLNDLYYPVYGNPDLKPERSTSSEVGARYRLDPQQHLALNLFRTDVTDLIVWDLVTFRPSNVNQARIRGLELEYGVGAERWGLAANLTLQEPRDLATDKPLLRRPDRKLAVTGARTLADGDTVQAEFLLVGERRDSHANAATGANEDRFLPGYGLVNVSAAHPLAPHWRLEGRVDNLFDQPYAEAFGFQTPGRVFELAIAYGE
jgi:vitamin B12 transporter